MILHVGDLVTPVDSEGEPVGPTVTVLEPGTAQLAVTWWAGTPWPPPYAPPGLPRPFPTPVTVAAFVVVTDHTDPPSVPVPVLLVDPETYAYPGVLVVCGSRDAQPPR